jgi:mannose-6-phosphate isomerase-like protein (cupin superfamily)
MPPDPEPMAPAARYDGPLALAQALSAFALEEAAHARFTREGLRADVEYRDLGLAKASGGRIGAKHIRAIAPLPAPTGWHWHDMSAHFVFVLRGSLTFRFAGIEGDVVVKAGSGLSQPAGVPHNVVARSDDLELLEINVPAEYGTWTLALPPAPWDGSP